MWRRMMQVDHFRDRLQINCQRPEARSILLQVQSQTERKKLHHLNHTGAGFLRFVVCWDRLLCRDDAMIVNNTVHVTWTCRNKSTSYIYITYGMCWRFLIWPLDERTRRGSCCMLRANSGKLCRTPSECTRDAGSQAYTCCFLEE